MLNVACFVQSCLTDADFVIFSNYCLIGTRRIASPCLCQKFIRCVVGAVIGGPPRLNKSLLGTPKGATACGGAVGEAD